MIDAKASTLHWDYGDETTQAALENGYVYDLPLTGPLQQEVRSGIYDMTFSHSFGHVGLYRLHTISPDDAISDQRTLYSVEVAHELTTTPSPSSWFGHPGITSLKCVYRAIMALDPTGKSQAHWTQRWKQALNTFDDGRLSATRT